NFPFGWFSDRYGRRIGIIIATTGAVAAGFYLSQFARTPLEIYSGTFVFGAFALPLFSLSAAHANDQADEDSYVVVAAGLNFFYSAGAIAGPLVAAIVIARFGPASFFTYTSIVHGALLVITIYRYYARSVPSVGRTRFVSLLRTSPVFFRMAGKSVRNRPALRRQGQDESL
ncbi:MAG: MFS transporter, partial [Alphaproteobacteria bacterium]